MALVLRIVLVEMVFVIVIDDFKVTLVRETV
jgi:hypothetical protein